MLKTPTADVTVQRLEEQPQGYGTPAGWLPEIRYSLVAKAIPYQPAGYTFSLRPKGRFILRKFTVPFSSATGWDLALKIGNKTVCARMNAASFSDLQLRAWPSKPETVAVGQDIFLTIYPRGEDRQTRFECILSGTEDKS